MFPNLPECKSFQGENEKKLPDETNLKAARIFFELQIERIVFCCNDDKG